MSRARGIVAAGIGLTIVARLFDAAPLYVPGVAFLLIGILAPAWTRLAARGATVERRMSVRRVVEDQEFEVELEVRCGRTPALSGAVLEPLAAEPIPLGARRGTSTRVISASFPRRGLRRFEPPALIIRDPFDLSRRVCPGSGAVHELLVLPRTEPIRVAGAGAATATAAPSLLHSARAPRAALAEVEIDGLRPYREGTSASRIHWAAMARGAGLLERRLRAETDSRPLVVLDARGAERAEDLDAAVRAAASIALELAEAGGCALLLPGERRASPLDGGFGPWAAAHARLAMVERTPGTPPPFLAGVGVRRGPTFYVAARRLHRLPAAADGVARGARILVIPGSLPGPSATFEVAGCSAYELLARHGGPKSAAARAAAIAGAHGG
ncbi:MAG TPA: DUF58 domain-containing protein [Solirubrobacteraceae bacterium]|jgi:uncharacterized protein (DUF58 family)|nr:DUF58 domain-containing protein [Solirubrobacteraceae bacterium]